MVVNEVSLVNCEIQNIDILFPCWSEHGTFSVKAETKTKDKVRARSEVRYNRLCQRMAKLLYPRGQGGWGWQR